MKQTIKFIITIGIVAVLTGCGNSSKVPSPMMIGKNFNAEAVKEMYKDLDIPKEQLQNGDYIFSRSNGEYSMLSMVKQNNKNKSILQKASEDTLSQGKKYFEVIKPNELNKLNINTWKEFDEHCLSSNPLGGGDSCDVTSSSWFVRTSGLVGHLMDNKADAQMLIKIYNIKPVGKKVFNAQNVLNEMKKTKDMQENININ